MVERRVTEDRGRKVVDANRRFQVRSILQGVLGIQISRINGLHVGFAWLICGCRLHMSLNPRLYKDKLVWITGASSGIGAALASAFAAREATLVLSARRRDRLEAVRAGCDSIEHLVQFSPPGQCIAGARSMFDLLAGAQAMRVRIAATATVASRLGRCQ